MIRLFSICLTMLLLSGCASQASKESSIHIHGIENNDLAVIEYYQDSSYVTSSKVVEPNFIDYSNAMEAAIYNRNLEAVRYLSSIDAAHTVSVRFYGKNQWQRTPINIPPAELACGIAEFEIMAFLLERYPDEKPNYTNCLHYLVSSISYYPSAHFFILKNPAPTFRNGSNTAIAAQKILDMGAQINTLPEYGLPMYDSILSSNTNNLLLVLLNNGLDASAPYPCHPSGQCAYLTDLAVYLDEVQSSERAKLLVQYGADINSMHDTATIVGVNPDGSYITKTTGMSALHNAEFFNRQALTATLLELGADPTQKNTEGLTAANYSGKFTAIREQHEKQIATNQKIAQQKKQTNEDDGGSIGGTIIDIISAIGAGGL
ncbi:hypothetical protein J9B83_07680 [Marinomonas sp. A79]|uniref:Ankyrin repeats (3 copies) n=1 Tax=Marinomonas vulgaris TaxID=2823372 RepID=A0ABS5HAZ8_9GAMM|nr:hypothetical protein [Marinomonas vulgaris]MBR7888823.1 hypothetical protein [Marinomonas vulgaris]